MTHLREGKTRDRAGSLHFTARPPVGSGQPVKIETVARRGASLGQDLAGIDREVFFRGVDRFLVDVFADKARGPVVEARLKKCVHTLPYEPRQ